MTLAVLIFLLCAHLIILLNLQFTAWPEVFSYPYLLNNGFNLYKDIALPYQPLLALILANVYKFFGYNLLTLQIFTWVIILLSDILIYIFSRKVVGRNILSLIPLSLYVLIQPFASGNLLWFDLATVPTILLAAIFLLDKKYILIGACLGIAFLIKQQTGVAIILIMIYLLFSRNFTNLFKLSLGIFLISLPVLIYIIGNKITSDYLFWTFTVPTYWYPKLPGYSRWPSVLEVIEISLLFIPGLILSMKYLKRYEFKILSLLFLGSFLVAFPRFEYFRFQPAIATHFILFSFFVKKKFSLVVLMSIFLAGLLISRDDVRTLNFEPRFLGQEEREMTALINNFASFNDKIYLLGIPSQYYVLSNRLPSKSWVDNYVWYMEIRGIQESVISGLEREKVKLIFWKEPSSGQWFEIGSYQPKKITEYIISHYQKEDNLRGDIQLWIRKD